MKTYIFLKLSLWKIRLYTKLLNLQFKLTVLRLVHWWQPERHIGAGRSQHHVFWIELYTLNWTGMIRIKNTHFVACIRVPNMYASICWSTEYKLRIRTKWCFYRNAFKKKHQKFIYLLKLTQSLKANLYYLNDQ